jgi:hypothetical protein
VEPEAAPAPSPVADRPRNWFAVAALWTLGATWLGAIAVVYYAELLDNGVSVGNAGLAWFVGAMVACTVTDACFH